MQQIRDYDDYLTRRGQLASAIEASGREASRLRSEAPHEQDTRAISIASDTAQSARAKLAELDAAWQEIAKGAQAAKSESTMPDRKARLGRVKGFMHARRVALRKIEKGFSERVKPAVDEYERASADARKEIQGLSGAVDIRSLSETLNDRRSEEVIARGLAANAGLWGTGTREDSFAYRDRDIDRSQTCTRGA